VGAVARKTRCETALDQPKLGATSSFKRDQYDSPSGNRTDAGKDGVLRPQTRQNGWDTCRKMANDPVGS
jgi:hypothetical protein